MTVDTEESLEKAINAARDAIPDELDIEVACLAVHMYFGCS